MEPGNLSHCDIPGTSEWQPDDSTKQRWKIRKYAFTVLQQAANGAADSEKQTAMSHSHSETRNTRDK